MPILLHEMALELPHQRGRDLADVHDPGAEESLERLKGALVVERRAFGFPGRDLVAPFEEVKSELLLGLHGFADAVADSFHVIQLPLIYGLALDDLGDFLEQLLHPDDHMILQIELLVVVSFEDGDGGGNVLALALVGDTHLDDA